MKDTNFEWLYILCKNKSKDEDFQLKKIKVDNELEKSIKDTFLKPYLCLNKNNIVVDEETFVKDFDEYNLDDDTQKNFYEEKANVIKFPEIDSKIKKDKIKEIEKIDDLDNFTVRSWIIHYKKNEKNIYLLQSFYKPQMYVNKTKLSKYIPLFFNKSWNIFSSIDNKEYLNLKKTIDVIYLWWKYVFCLNRNKYKSIFDYREYIKDEATKFFTDNFISDENNIFNIDNEDIISEMIANNYSIAKKVKLISENKDSNNDSMIKKFDEKMLDNLKKSYSEAEYNKYFGWLLELDKNKKINLNKSNFEKILDILNRDYLRCNYTWEDFKSKAKKKL